MSTGRHRITTENNIDLPAWLPTKYNSSIFYGYALVLILYIAICPLCVVNSQNKLSIVPVPKKQSWRTWLNAVHWSTRMIYVIMTKQNIGCTSMGYAISVIADMNFNQHSQNWNIPVVGFSMVLANLVLNPAIHNRLSLSGCAYFLREVWPVYGARISAVRNVIIFTKQVSGETSLFMKNITLCLFAKSNKQSSFQQNYAFRIISSTFDMLLCMSMFYWCWLIVHTSPHIHFPALVEPRDYPGENHTSSDEYG